LFKEEEKMKNKMERKKQKISQSKDVFMGTKKISLRHA
jgi:hypothetical protein